MSLSLGYTRRKIEGESIGLINSIRQSFKDLYSYVDPKQKEQIDNIKTKLDKISNELKQANLASLKDGLTKLKVQVENLLPASNTDLASKVHQLRQDHDSLAIKVDHLEVFTARVGINQMDLTGKLDDVASKVNDILDNR